MRFTSTVYLFIAFSVWGCSSGSRSSTDPIINPNPGQPGTAQDVTTYRNDQARTSQNLNEATLTSSNVNATSFGKIGFLPVDGKVDAQPLYLSELNIPSKGAHNVLYIATEHDSVYAFDADNGTTLWQASLLGANETTSDARNCSQVIPEIGITATPVIDRSRGPMESSTLLPCRRIELETTSNGCMRSTLP